MKKLCVSNSSAKIKYVLLLLFFCFFFSKENHSQVFTQKDGIPMILFTEGPADIPQNEVIKMKNLGVDIIQHSNVEDYMIERFAQNNLKVMPYQNWKSNNYIYQYTGAHYTEWEAEGTPLTKGNVTVDYNSDIATPIYENGILGIKTNEGAGAANLISGPGYRQDGHKRYHPEDPIIYQADFELKIKPTDPNINLLDPAYKDVEVCLIAVVSHEIISNKENGTIYVSENPLIAFKKTLTVEDFTDYAYHPHSITNINWIAGRVSPITQETFWKEDVKYEGQYVEFIIDWAGSNLLELYVDKIVVSDQLGRDLKDPSSDAMANLTDEYNSLVNKDGIEIYYSIDEPTSIDNYEPYRMVDNLIQDISNNTKRIITSLNTHYNGKYGPTELPFGSYQHYIAEEFWKRAKPMFLWLNAYPYHYYYKPGEHPNWQEENINLQIEKIRNASENDPNWGQDIQCTKWIDVDVDDDGNCVLEERLITPSVEMMSYSTNLALLFGAKKIGFYEYYSLKNTTCNVWYADGLVDQNGVPNSRYYKIKDDIAPALNGLFGKTLKNTTPTEQFVNLNLTSPLPVVNYSFIQKIEAINYSEATNMFLDLGFFTESIPQDKYYSIGVNRWYSTVNEMKYTFQNPNPGYNNYRVMNLQDTTSTYIDFANDNKYLTTYLEFGDAHFIRLTPALKNGGWLTSNEQINSPTSLTEETLEIKNGAVLTINSAMMHIKT